MTPVADRFLCELLIPPDLVDAVAAEVMRRLDEQITPASPWLCGAKQAAEYLDWPVERVYKGIRRLPHYRDGNLLMFRKDELDALIADSYEGPPRPSNHEPSRPSRHGMGDPVPFQARKGGA